MDGSLPVAHGFTAVHFDKEGPDHRVCLRPHQSCLCCREGTGEIENGRRILWEEQVPGKALHADKSTKIEHWPGSTGSAAHHHHQRHLLLRGFIGRLYWESKTASDASSV